MKPDTYDTIIDTTKELFGYSGWLVLAFCLVGCVLAFGYWILLDFIEIELSIIMLSIADLIISLLIIAFVFMISKAQDRFSIKQWRDYWMAFGHQIQLSIPEDKPVEDAVQELKIWCDENTPRLYRITDTSDRYRNSKITLVFKHRTDAVACKLKWG
ncbi:hypothetical protein LCGC14_1393310 [marine sediment metagenome]|uniref:Uncharacterized protein n=1 Tax=marine sediment metagenome TaxID=412755 RepID=A0A0F9MES9_9ZZZZ